MWHIYRIWSQKDKIIVHRNYIQNIVVWEIMAHDAQVKRSTPNIKPTFAHALEHFIWQ